MIPEIKDTQDWYAVDAMLKKLARQIPGFYHDYYRLSKNIEIKIKELGLIDIELRKRHSEYHVKKKLEKLHEINDVIRMFSKMHLLASLSKR